MNIYRKILCMQLLAAALCLQLTGCEQEPSQQPEEVIEHVSGSYTAVEDTAVDEPTYADEETIAAEEDVDDPQNTIDAEGETSIELEIPPEDE